MNVPAPSVPLKYIAFEDRQAPGDWRVEAISEPDGDCYVAIFCGPDAEFRANEYAAIKNGKHPAHKPAPLTSVVQSDPRAVEQIVVKIQDGQEVILHLKGLKWTYDVARKIITGRPKSPVEFANEKGNV